MIHVAQPPPHLKLNPLLSSNVTSVCERGKKVNFGKVLKMIDEMVKVLTAEQQDDDDKKEYCNTAFDLADDKKKSLERSVSNIEKAMAKEKEGIAALAEDIAALEEGLLVCWLASWLLVGWLAGWFAGWLLAGWRLAAEKCHSFAD